MSSTTIYHHTYSDSFAIVILRSPYLQTECGTTDRLSSSNMQVPAVSSRTKPFSRTPNDSIETPHAQVRAKTLFQNPT